MFDDLERDDVDLAEWIERELMQQQESLDAAGISISAGKMSTLWVDPLALERIVKELLDNAIRFSPQGGSISLHTEQRMGQDVLIVRDSGLGMGESNMERIFQPFFTTDKERKGLGLAVVQALVQAHGGRTWCESTLGMGSIFYVGLPNKQT